MDDWRDTRDKDSVFRQGTLPMTGTYVVAPPANPDVDKVDSMPTDLLGREYETFPAPEPLQQHGPARVIAMCNQKGGVGKTTSSINIAGALAQYGRRVLIVDFDPQGAATVGLGVNANTVENTIYTALFDISVDPHDVVQHTAFENIDVIPANIDLSAAEVQLVTEVGREQILNSVLRKLKSEYDLIIVDCQPSLGLLTVNALAAADGVIIPVAAEFFALRGVALLMQSIEKSAVPHQSRIGSGWRAHHHVHQDTALRRGLPARLRGVQRKGVPHVHLPLHQTARFHGCRRARGGLCP